MEGKGGIRDAEGEGCCIVQCSFSCKIVRTLRFANDEDAEGKEVWCSNDNKSIRVYIGAIVWCLEVIVQIRLLTDLAIVSHALVHLSSKFILLISPSLLNRFAPFNL